ncbi:MAG: TlpA disulfide reductase family protein [Pseudomonadota bacterium]
MRPLQALLAAAVAVAGTAAGVLSFQWQSGGIGAADPAQTGRLVLAAQLQGLDGKPQGVGQWRGSILVVNFWATWCGPCREEIPAFIRLQNQYRERGVTFVGIAVDQKDKVESYAREIGINYPVLVGGLETMELARQAGNKKSVLPFTLVLDRNALAVTSQIGPIKPEKLEAVLIPLL